MTKNNRRDGTGFGTIFSKKIILLVGLFFWCKLALAAVPIILAKPAHRIISLAPHLTELLAAAGAEKKIVGVSMGSDYPYWVKRLPQVGDAYGLNFEAILALHPDLILAWHGGTSPADILRLQSLGIPVYVCDVKSLQDIPVTLRKLGLMADTTLAAEKAANLFNAQYARLKRIYSNVNNNPAVFYQLWSRPLMSVGGKGVINEIINLCGGRNAFGNVNQEIIAITPEALLQAHPQVILITHNNLIWQRQWEHWFNLAATGPYKPQFYPVDSTLLERYGPRVLIGAEEVCKGINGLH